MRGSNGWKSLKTRYSNTRHGGNSEHMGSVPCSGMESYSAVKVELGKCQQIRTVRYKQYIKTNRENLEFGQGSEVPG